MIEGKLGTGQNTPRNILHGGGPVFSIFTSYGQQLVEFTLAWFPGKSCEKQAFDDGWVGITCLHHQCDPVFLICQFRIECFSV